MPKPKNNFEFFREKCEYWRKKLNLTDWHISYINEKLEDSVATAETNIVAKTAWISLNTEIKEYHDLDKIAFEEVCHVLLARIIYCGEQYYSADIIHEYEHTIINQFWNAFNS